MKILGYINAKVAKVGRKHFQTKKRNENLHEISNDNGVKFSCIKKSNYQKYNVPMLQHS
jgi:hypothetical protein